MPLRSSLQQGTQTFPSRTCMLCWFPHASLLQGLGRALQTAAGARPWLERCWHYGQCLCVGAFSVHIGCYHVQLACRPGHNIFQLAATCPDQAPQVQGPIRPLASNIMVWLKIK